jgi:hypothetical protein
MENAVVEVQDHIWAGNIVDMGKAYLIKELVVQSLKVFFINCGQQFEQQHYQLGSTV